MNKHFLEKVQIASGFVPVNLAAGANDGDWMSLKNYGRCAVLLFKAAGADGQDPTLSLEQATDVAGTGAKSLTFTRIDVKQGAALTAISEFTEIANADADYTQVDAGQAQAIWVVDVKAEDLDIDGGFDCIRARVADVGSTAQLGCLLYFLHEPRYADAPMPGALTD